MIATSTTASDRRLPRLAGRRAWEGAARTAETTLLVFTLGARGEGRRKRLLPPALRDRETALYRACLEETLAAGRGAGCRLEVCSPAGIDLPADARAVGQAGRGFGERFAQAFDAALGRAPGPVVAVGTDTPGLTREHVERALSLLPAAPGDGGDTVVIGPSPDGGLYLLASNRPLGDILRAVRWCRPSTLGHLRRLLRQAGLAVILLEPLADLDRRQDLEQWVARSRPRSRPRSRRPRHARSALHGAVTRPDGAAVRPSVRAARAIALALGALRRPPCPFAVRRPPHRPAPIHRGRAPPSSPPTRPGS